jgi:hypothetical protein
VRIRDGFAQRVYALGPSTQGSRNAETKLVDRAWIAQYERPTGVRLRQGVVPAPLFLIAWRIIGRRIATVHELKTESALDAEMAVSH